MTNTGETTTELHNVEITGSKAKGYAAHCTEPECFWMNTGRLILNRAHMERKVAEHQKNMARYEEAFHTA